jgi:hypothetical protein
MTKQEFYETIKEYAKKEMFDQGVKAAASTTGNEIVAHQAASNEAAKFYQMIITLWVDAD